MAGKKKSIAKKSKSGGDATLGQSKNVSESNVPKVEENVEKTKIQPRKRRKGVDGVIAEAFLSSLDKDSKSDTPQAEGNIEKTNNQPRKRRKGADEEMVEAFLSSPNKGSSVLRRRKQIPTFRKVDLSECDCKKIVGKRIKVFWPGSRKWFVGHVNSYDSKNRLHTVFYDDGDEENLNLKDERFELEVVPDDGFTLCSEQGDNHKKKEMGSNDGVFRKETKEEKTFMVGVTATEPEKGSLLLRPRKQIPAFRKVDLAESDFKKIVGKRIKVYWPDSRKWFVGRVNSFDNKKVHTVFYDDGDTEDLVLKAERFELEVVPSDGFTLCSELGANLKKSEMDSNGDEFSKETKEEDSIKVGVNANGPDKVSSAGVTATGPDKDSSVLRRRKQIPTFRKLDLSESDCKRIVGKRIKVYWPDSRKWFVGRVNSYDSKNRLHTVFYDDGDEENLDLKDERFELEVVPSDGFTLCSELGANLKKKEMSSNCGDAGKETKEEESFKVAVGATDPDQGSFLLRPRKQIPAFRKVDLGESDCKKIVGKRIKVYWPDSRKWFVGHVTSFDSEKKLHTVFYDDGDVENLDLKTERFELEVVPDDGFTLHSELGSNLKEKEMGSNVGDVCNETEEDSFKVKRHAKVEKEVMSKVAKKPRLIGGALTKEKKTNLTKHAEVINCGSDLSDDGETESLSKVTVETNGRKLASKAARRSSKLRARKDSMADKGENLVTDVKMNILPKNVSNLKNGNTSVVPGDYKSGTIHNETEMLQNRSRRKTNGASAAIQIAKPKRHIKGENGETRIKEKQESENSEAAGDKVKEMQSGEENNLAGVSETDTQVAELEISEAETLKHFLKNYVKKRQATAKK